MLVKKESLLISCLQTPNNQGTLQIKKSSTVKRKAESSLCEEKVFKRAALQDTKNHPKQEPLELFVESLKNISLHNVNVAQKKDSDDERVNYRFVPKRDLPPGVEYDIDVETFTDTSGVPEYASEVFEYLKSREKLFQVEDYIERQVGMTPSMRSILVDWMVSVQHNFGLDLETLYKAVKLVDLYLMKVVLGSKNLFQLLGITCLFICAKYGEANWPVIGDCVYVCGDLYSHHDVVKMEMDIFKAIGFELGIPDAYGFLGRFAKCAKVTTETFLLASYILEFSLMNYVTISFSESKMAAAALYIAMQNAKPEQEWKTTIEYYSGYRLSDFRHIVLVLNDGMRKPYKKCEAIFSKYSKIYYSKPVRVTQVVLKKTHELKL